MFGHQMEAELVLNFLLHTQPHGAEELEVLPVVGPGRVGKTTLVTHVCNDERVRDRFSKIMFVTDHDLKDKKLTNLGERCLMKYENSMVNKDGRLLIVIEVAGDCNESEWKRLFAASKWCLTNGSKNHNHKPVRQDHKAWNDEGNNTEIYVRRSILVLLQDTYIWKHRSHDAPEDGLPGHGDSQDVERTSH